jgi:hypothetical protein
MELKPLVIWWISDDQDTLNDPRSQAQPDVPILIISVSRSVPGDEVEIHYTQRWGLEVSN